MISPLPAPCRFLFNGHLPAALFSSSTRASHRLAIAVTVAARVLLGAVVGSATAAHGAELSVLASPHGTGQFLRSPSGPLRAEAELANSVSLATSSAEANYGILNLYAELETTQIRSGRGIVNSQGRWDDIVTINAAGLTGQTGTVTTTFRIDGRFALTLSPNLTSPNSFIRAYLEVSLRNSPLIKEYKLNSANIESGNGNFLNQDLTLSTEFIYGEPFDVRFYLVANAQVDTSFASNALVDLSHTARWGGFTEVLDAGGNRVADFNATSDSGFNYAAPVPEPSSVMLLGLVGAAMVWGRKTRPAVR